jgi:hypothetical protein
MTSPIESDPADKFTEPSEIVGVSFEGILTFSCCRLVQKVQGNSRSEVQCSKCGTLYGIALLVRLQPEKDCRFKKGTRVRPTKRVEVKAGSTRMVLEPSQTYMAGQDTYGALNVPEGHQPILVELNGDRGKRKLVASVPENLLEPA